MNQAVVESIAKTYGTPFYYYEEEVILKQIQKVKQVLGDLSNHLTYALKANSNPEILTMIQREGLGMEVATPGEMRLAMKSGTNPSEVIWNSNGKPPETIHYFCEQSVGAVNIDSLEELDLWGFYLSGHPLVKIPRLFLRINPDIDPKTHPYLSTGLLSSKFGVQEHLIPLSLKKAKDLHLSLAGLHAHIGSQILDTSPLQTTYARMFALSRFYGFSEVNLGGGWGIPYQSQSLDLTEISKTIQHDGTGLTISLELGRFIVGEAGTYVARVIGTKWSGSRHFVVLDGGMNHLIRPALYGAVHPYEFFGNITECKADFDIVGPLCESGDILVKNTSGYLPEVGSLVAINLAGAYGYSMASHYNGTGRPAEILIDSKGTFREIRAREIA